MADNKKLVLLAPSYYGEFKCIQDKCRHSCCIDWEIVIDDITLEKYKEKDTEIMKTVTESEDGACFSLSPDGRCPHLNENGLCNIIISHGEGYLSDICRRHPRFFNSPGDKSCELGLGIVCEEACRIILEHEGKFSLIPIDESDPAWADFSALPTASVVDFNPCAERDAIISKIEDESLSLAEKLSELKLSFGLTELHTNGEWLELLLSLEILDTEWEELLTSLSNTEESAPIHTEAYDKYFERLLVYFVFRHVSAAVSRDNLCARLAFSIFSLELIMSLFFASQTRSLETLIELAREYSAEIEYSEDNTSALIFEFESAI